MRDSQLVIWILDRVWRKMRMVEYSRQTQNIITGPSLCSCGPRVGTYQTLQKLVPLLSIIGTERQLSLTVSLSRGDLGWPIPTWFQALTQID